MKLLRAAALAMSATLMLAACGSADGDSSSGNDSIKIGAWFPLSGAQASSGNPQMVGASTFWKKVNADGGINGEKVDFVYKDNAFDPQQTLQIAREMVTRDKVDVIANANGTATTEATFPLVLEQNKTPIFGTYGGLTSWYDPPKDLLFGTQTLYENQAKIAAEWALEEGARKITIVHDDPAAFVTVKDTAAKTIQAEGGSADNVEVKIGTTDYGPALAAVKKQDPDAVLLILPPQEAAAYLNEAALQRVDVQAYGYAPAVIEATVELAGANAEGFRGVALTKPTTADDPAVQEYRDDLAKYGDGAEPDLYSLATYGYAKALSIILGSIDGKVDKASIAKAIESAQDVETGIVPPLSYSSDDHLGTDAGVRVEVENGEFVAKSDFISPKQ
ncbi:ABC transporter substrate-binding protein [Nocardioides kongjuensis]|uniref:ABC-type branched-subunit amino acid transport system substrate-binding protein n=1 Tax=Nocardioides kongjuensis TaxID=349522 RepID=A0A852RHS1_9ACTN|nr:ABC transporter substrate-binding protein [Nocardioides kongjuensis]NYD28886.1 ABC-type branched-subunit amino acid transport system substrate-binding protein [Nocardioides kongjuensis]